MSVNLSIIGLWNYDDTLFDDMALPESVDRDILVKNILLECAELEVLYPNPEFMKSAITAWSERMAPTWNSLASTFALQYNPIWNVDGTETETEIRNLATSNTETRDLESSSSSSASNQDNGTSTHKVNGFNEVELKDAESDTSITSSSSSISNSGTDEGTISHAGTDTGSITRTKTRGGNIGVTMTQQMLEAEITVRPKLNIYSFIIESFKDRFCLLIY